MPSGEYRAGASRYGEDADDPQYHRELAPRRQDYIGGLK